MVSIFSSTLYIHMSTHTFHSFHSLSPPPPSSMHSHSYGDAILFPIRADYMHLVFCSLPNHKKPFKTLLPCIHKPSRLWAGKQVVSTVLCNIVQAGKHKLNLNSTAKISVLVSCSAVCQLHIWTRFGLWPMLRCPEVL